ncbi:Protein ROOT HAIR DEFECTIVE 3-like protein 2 [Forsythia ovata]|uniref:Protein ROOT HAIR DEFECTIVE 3-like protein 2 n=1 Tax=Forsythia ovata TaxID=205694 RepID=A0ABD1U5Z4_9LAMI
MRWRVYMLAMDRHVVILALGFSFIVQQIWKISRENKDIDLLTQKVMVAIVYCEEITNEKLSSFIANEDELVDFHEIQDHLISEYEATTSHLMKKRKNATNGKWKSDESRKHEKSQVRAK